MSSAGAFVQAMPAIRDSLRLRCAHKIRMIRSVLRPINAGASAPALA